MVSHHEEIFLLIPRSLLRGGFIYVSATEHWVEFECALNQSVIRVYDLQKRVVFSMWRYAAPGQ